MPVLRYETDNQGLPAYRAEPNRDWVEHAKLCMLWSAAFPRADAVTGRVVTTDNTTKVASPSGPAIDCSTGQTNLAWASWDACVTSDGAGGGDFTFLLLANPVASGSGAIEHGLVQKNDAGGAPHSQANIMFHCGTNFVYSNGAASFLTYNSTAVGATATGAIDGLWHLWVGVRSGTIHRLYKDGVLVASNSSTIRNILLSGSPRYVEVGSRGNGTTEAYRDHAALAAMFNSALSPEQIGSLALNPAQLFEPEPIEFYWAAGGQTISIGQATETELAQAIAWSPQNRLLVQATETDLAQAISALKLKELAQSTETDAAQAITPVKTLAIGQVTETDLAQAIASAKVKALGQVTETDLAQAITRSGQIVALAQVSETDAAQAISARKTKELGQASETDLAQTITEPGAQIVALEQASETDAAQSITSGKRALLGQVIEADVAQLVTILKRKAVGQALETDIANAVTWSLRRLVGQASETDSAGDATRLTDEIPAVTLLRIQHESRRLTIPDALRRLKVAAARRRLYIQ